MTHVKLKKQEITGSSSPSTRFALLTLLADGHYHSGSDLGRSLNISRAAVWKQIQSLIALGMDIYSVKGRGYQLQAVPELLSKEAIVSAIDKETKDSLSKLEIHFEISSTNDYLLQHLNQKDLHGHVALAEYQSQGRGRRGANWVSPPAAGIYLSIAWHYEETPIDIACLSLASGVAVVRALESCGIQDVGLKWPNDIFWQERKLGGILVESKGEHAGPCDLVLGVGLNVNLPNLEEDEIDQPWVDLNTITQALPSRNHVVAALLKEFVSLLSCYSSEGFAKDIEQWRALDCAKGKKAVLNTSQESMVGRVIGIDDQGLLLMSVNGYIERYMSGQISFKVES